MTILLDQDLLKTRDFYHFKRRKGYLVLLAHGSQFGIASQAVEEGLGQEGGVREEWREQGERQEGAHTETVI